MATDLMRSLRVCCNGWVLLSLSAIPAIALAQTLEDPTKLPAELGSRTEGGVPEASDLQSIIISPTRRAAIINGQTIELGGKAGDVRLIEVSERRSVTDGKGATSVDAVPKRKNKQESSIATYGR